MNKELLDKLKFQAAAQVSPLLEGEEWQKVYSEKFAELIVRECADLLETSLPYNPQQKMIKKHFGVEE